MTDEETEKSIVSQESSKQDEIPIEIHETKEINREPTQNAGIPTELLIDITHEKGTELTESTQRSEEIDQVVNQLLEALNEDNTPTSYEEKEKIINQYYLSDEDLVDTELNDWLTIDSCGHTPAVETVIPVNFEDI